LRAPPSIGSSCARNPVSVMLSGTSSKLELQLDFLARELELEKNRREKLQDQVETLVSIIKSQHDSAPSEVVKAIEEKATRETLKGIDTDMENPKNQEKGYLGMFQ
jgi:hypothetical protein